MSETVTHAETDIYEPKAGAKRWCAFLDEEAKPLSDSELAERTAGYRLGYCETAIEMLLNDDEIVERGPEFQECYEDAVARAFAYLAPVAAAAR